MHLLSIVIRPFVAFALFFLAAVLGRLVLRLIPQGRVKAFLSKPMHVYPATPEERRDWMPVFWLWLAVLIEFSMLWYLSH